MIEIGKEKKIDRKKKKEEINPIQMFSTQHHGSQK